MFNIIKTLRNYFTRKLLHESNVAFAQRKSLAAILGGKLFGGSVLPAQYCPCGISQTSERTFHIQPNTQHPIYCWRREERGGSVCEVISPSQHTIDYSVKMTEHSSKTKGLSSADPVIPGGMFSNSSIPLLTTRGGSESTCVNKSSLFTNELNYVEFNSTQQCIYTRRGRSRRRAFRSNIYRRRSLSSRQF